MVWLGADKNCERASLKECSGKAAMLELLKLEGCAWAVIAACKGKKEDVKVLSTFGLTSSSTRTFRRLRRKLKLSSALFPLKR